MEGACGSVGKSVGFGHVPCEMTYRFEPQSTREIYHYECAILSSMYYISTQGINWYMLAHRIRRKRLSLYTP